MIVRSVHIFYENCSTGEKELQTFVTFVQATPKYFGSLVHTILE